MKALRFLLFLAALLGLSACSGGKTRLDCFDECKRKGLTYSGLISRNVRIDEAGEQEITEICRCDIENPIL